MQPYEDCKWTHSHISYVSTFLRSAKATHQHCYCYRHLCHLCRYRGDGGSHGDEEGTEGEDSECQLPALDEGDDVSTEPGTAPLDEDRHLVPQTLADLLHVAAMGWIGGLKD